MSELYQHFRTFTPVTHACVKTRKVKIVDPMVPELPCTEEELEMIKKNLKEVPSGLQE